MAEAQMNKGGDKRDLHEGLLLARGIGLAIKKTHEGS